MGFDVLDVGSSGQKNKVPTRYWSPYSIALAHKRLPYFPVVIMPEGRGPGHREIRSGEWSDLGLGFVAGNKYRKILYISPVYILFLLIYL